MSARRWVLRTLTSLCALVGLFALSGGLAQAAITHSFVGSFGPDGPGGAEKFVNPKSIAVDSAGDVYVYEEAAGGKIRKFNASGQPLEFSGLKGTDHPDVIEAVGISHESNSAEIAVDDSAAGPAKGDIYAATIEGEAVDIYSPTGEKLGELKQTEGVPWGSPCGVTVDSAGSVYVGLYPNHVNKYTPTGQPVTSANYISSLWGVEKVCPIAADSEGSVYVKGYSQTPVRKYPAFQFSPIEVLAEGEEIDSTGSTIATDPAIKGHVYVDEENDIAEYETSAGVERLGVSGSVGDGMLSGSFGVAVTGEAGSETVYANDDSGVVNIYGPAVVVADVTTGAASEVKPNGVTMSGIVNPDKIAVSVCRFEYRTEAEASFAKTADCSPPPGAGEAPVPVTASPSGLTPSTAYRYRLAATNEHGTNYGQEETFTTPPAVDSLSTGPTEDITTSGARLTGSLSPDGVDVHYYFQYGIQYGTSIEYDATSPVPPGVDAGTGGAECEPPGGPKCSAVAAETSLGGLQANTTYHYRLVAVNSFGTTYGQDETFMTHGLPGIGNTSNEAISQTTATLTATVNPHGIDTTYRFEYGPGASYGTSIPVPDADIGAGTSDVPIGAELSGLQSGATYHYRVVAVNAAGTVDGVDHTFTTVPPAQIDNVSAADVVASSATLNAKVDPLGTDTTYHFEWGTDLSYGQVIPVPDSDIGAGTTDVAVSQHLTGLQPNTIYHYRVVATNSLGSARSGDHTFVYDTNGGGLPDSRAYEMVTPPGKNGALIGPGFLIIAPQVSEDGSRMIASSIQCFAGAASCVASRQTEGEPYLFTRTSGGWVTTALAPPAMQFDTNSPWFAGANSGTALFSIPTQPLGEDDWYLRQAGGSFVDLGPTTPGPAGTIGDKGLVATADFSHIAWDSDPAWPFDLSVASSVYEYVGTGNAAPVLVGVTGGLGSTDLISTCETALGGKGGFSTQIDGSVSADGRIVYFTSRACTSGSGANVNTPVPANALYARIDESRTVPISGTPSADCTTSSCKNSPAGDALFQGASADGSKVFFLSTQQLTDSASEDSHPGDTPEGGGCSVTSGANGCNLYEYDFANPVGHNLIDVSAGDVSGGGPRVQGVVTASSDGSHVYFVAKGVLSATANSQGETAEDGANNLYVFERDASNPGGRVAFIAALPVSDSPNWENADGRANVTPDGRFLVFESHRTLTPDDTRKDSAVQVFRYDAQTGVLVRISIGERGFNDNGNAGTGDAQTARVEYSTLTHAGPARLDPTMSHDGAYVFFQSPIGLTPQALNDVPIDSEGRLAQNVYEYHDGHVYLISDGRDTSKQGTLSSVELFGSDATGANVFFTTDDPLVPQDTDTGRDFYDARICTASDPCVARPSPSSPPCLGEACHGTPAAPPVAPISPTATFNGFGNIVPQPSTAKKPAVKKAAKCPRGKKRSHGKCVKKMRKETRKAKSHKGGK